MLKDRQYFRGLRNLHGSDLRWFQGEMHWVRAVVIFILNPKRTYPVWWISDKCGFAEFELRSAGEDVDSKNLF